MEYRVTFCRCTEYFLALISARFLHARLLSALYLRPGTYLTVVTRRAIGAPYVTGANHLQLLRSRATCIRFSDSFFFFFLFLLPMIPPNFRDIDTRYDFVFSLLRLRSN